MMYIYNFSWSCYEGYESMILLHKEKYSEKQFKNICYKACKEIIPVIFKKHNGFIGLDIIRYYASSLLIKKYRFSEADIILCSFWGGSIIEKEDDKRDYGDEECPKEIIGEKLFNEVVKHNEKVNKRIGRK